MKIKEIEYLDLPKPYFDCYVQQLCYITTSIHGSYWKLFILPSFKFVIDENSNDIADSIIINNGYEEALNRFYHINLFEKSLYEVKQFPIICKIPVSKYPLCKNVEDSEDRDMHCFIGTVCDEELGKIEIIDNFYKKKDTFFLDMSKLLVFDIVLNKNKYESFEYISIAFLENFKRNRFTELYDKSKKYYLARKDFINFDFDTEDFFDRFKELYSIKYKFSIILEKISEISNKPYYKTLAYFYLQLAYKWRKLWISLLKYEVKKGSISLEYMVERLKEMDKYISLEKSIEDEVLYSKLFKQVKNVVAVSANITNITKWNEDLTVTYNGISVLNLINDIEAKLSIEIDGGLGIESKTYIDLACNIYKIVLENIVEKNESTLF